eukprot:CAMPEP_0201552958 /NCGR_PEP_ID=MMETSP0173_2-20130828/19360_1 /ASSEMBLY_ACC=CAM_ASM_000268 /TAXON_ID=218659 /ORGANISM="Vexillifera sp., Strain DIVA3 564/2" /LENGTH=558 /DNA_ID=CAMNT_0047963551 /DNA_START=49 /DNA_END=1725 /DNA_ORIENTATION=-
MNSTTPLIIIFLLGLSLICTSFANDVKEVPGITYIGKSYNAFLGNPASAGSPVDPGWRQSIFTFNYDHGTTVVDGYTVPQGYQINSAGAGSCSLSAIGVDTSWTGAYYNRLAKQASVDASVVGEDKAKASFSRSKDYSSVKEGWAQHSYITFLSQAYCTSYSGSVQTGTPPAITDNFKTAVKNLPEKYAQGAYFGWIDNWGTHYANSLAAVGSSFGQLASMTTENYMGLQEKNVSVSTAASFGSKLSFGINNMNSQQTAQGKAFNNACAELRLISFGSRPPTDGSPITWAQTAGSNPVPLSYNLTDISSLLTKKFFPKFDKISKIQTNLRQALRIYCNSTQGCVQPSPQGTCGAPGSALNAIQKGTSYDWTDEVTFKCNAGYKKTSGDSFLLCASNNKWLDSSGNQGSALQCANGPFLRVKTLRSGSLYGSCLQYEGGNTRFHGCNSDHSQIWKQVPAPNADSDTFMLCNPSSGSALRMKRVGVIETCDAKDSCSWNGDKHKLWKWLSVEGSQRLNNMYWQSEVMNACHIDGTCGRNQKDCNKDSDADCQLQRDLIMF